MTRRQPPRPRRATLADVAALAGTSAPTVSKVLRGGSDISPATRQTVMEAMEAAGYVPRGDRPPASLSPGLIDFVLSDVHGSWVSEALAGVEEAASAASQDVVITIARDDGMWVRRLLRRNSAGAVIALVDPTHTQLNTLRTARIPFVLVDPMSRPPDWAQSVGVTNWEGGRSAAQHLLSLGHESFGIVGGVRHHLYSQARIDGFQSGLRGEPAGASAGLSIEYSTWQRRDAKEAAIRLLEADPRPSAIFACSDGMAIGVYDAAAELGLRIPQDVSVVGFDDIPEAAWANPPLTTVRQPIADLGAAATRMLLRMHAGTGDQPREELATRLIVRASTSHPKHGGAAPQR